MSEPERLLQGPLGDEERIALNAGLRLRPSEAAKGRMWQALSAELAVLGALAASEAAALETARAAAPLAQTGALGTAKVAAGTSLASLGKLLVTWTLATTGVGLATTWIVTEATLPTLPAPKPGRSPTPVAVPVATPLAPRAVPKPESKPEGTPLAGVTDPGPTRAPGVPGHGRATTTNEGPERDPSGAEIAGLTATGTARVAEESALVARARSELLLGRPDSCLATLRETARRFPGGALEQERQALRIEALEKQGHPAAAGALAREFIRLYPESPYANRAREFVAGGR